MYLCELSYICFVARWIVKDKITVQCIRLNASSSMQSKDTATASQYSQANSCSAFQIRQKKENLSKVSILSPISNTVFKIHGSLFIMLTIYVLQCITDVDIYLLTTGSSVCFAMKYLDTSADW